MIGLFKVQMAGGQKGINQCLEVNKCSIKDVKFNRGQIIFWGHYRTYVSPEDEVASSETILTRIIWPARERT